MDVLDLLEIEPTSWLAYDLIGAIQRFGRTVERKIDEAVKHARDEHKELCEGIRKAGAKAPGPLSEQQIEDVAMEAWYLWVKGMVRTAIGVPALKPGQSTGDLSVLTRQKRAYLVKPATFNPEIDSNMDTDDVRIVYED